jgi:hypothetical protein
MWDEEFLSIFHLMVCPCVESVFGFSSFLSLWCMGVSLSNGGSSL